MAETSSPFGFETVLESANFDDWETKLRQVFGECQADVRRHNVHGFGARISLCVIGCLALVELEHKGGRKRSQVETPRHLNPSQLRLTNQVAFSHPFCCVS